MTVMRQEVRTSNNISKSQRGKNKKRVLSKRKRRKESQSYQTLEPRSMLAANPIATPDVSYVTPFNAPLTITDPALGVQMISTQTAPTFRRCRILVHSMVT